MINQLFAFLIFNILVLPHYAISKSWEQEVNISVLEDYTESWTIDSVLTKKRQLLFDSNLHENAYFGYNHNPHWFRIKLPHNVNRNEVFIIIKYPSLYDAVFYDDITDSTSNIRKSGSKYPHKAGKLKSRNIVFESNKFGNSNVFYLKVTEENSLIVPITVTDSKGYETAKLIDQILYGIFFGFVLAMLLYNLMLFFSLRDVTYLYYVIAMVVGGFISVIRSGYALIYIWPESPILDWQVYYFCGGLSIMASARFVSHYLQLPRNFKKLDVYFWIMTALAFVLVILSLTIEPSQITTYAQFLLLIAVPSFLVIGVVVYLKGYTPSIFFIIAWIPYILGLVFIALKGGGWVAYHPLIDVSAEVGISLEAILLSLALADRVNRHKKAQMKAEKKGLQSELEKQVLQSHNKGLALSLQLKEKNLQHENQQMATSTLWLSQKNEVLLTIQKILKNTGNHSDQKVHSEIEKTISQNLHAEEDWVRFKGHFEKVHSGFFTTLRNNYPRLTPNEHRLCAFLRMNMTSKEIALLLGITVNAIEQARRRMRKKLNISNTDTNLLTFLHELS